MVSVTSRIKEIKQPRGGYLTTNDFKLQVFNDNQILYEEENIHASLGGLAVDYLTRFLSKKKTSEDAFKISILGAQQVSKGNVAKKILSNITGLDDKSIINACKLVSFDVYLRVSPTINTPSFEIINPDKKTIKNIRTMVERTLHFFNNYEPILRYQITFIGGYTRIIDTGDADLLTETTLIDLKTSKKSTNK